MTDQTIAILQLATVPLAWTIVGIVAVLALRRPLARLIDRTKRAKLLGVELDASGDGG